MATDVGAIFVRAGLDDAGFSRGLRRMDSGLSRAGRSLGKLAGVATGAVAAGLGAAVYKAAEFDRSMRNVNSIAKLSEGQFKDVGKAVLGMAAETGQAPKQLADGLYDIVSSGFKAADAVTILKTSATAATAGMTDTATASAAVVAALNAWKMPASQAAAVASTLFETVNKGVVTFPELAQNMGDLTSLAPALGVSLQEVSGAFAAMTLQGGPAAEHSTRLKGIMAQLVKPSDDLKGAIKGLGFENSGAAIKALGFAGTLNALYKSVGGNREAIAKLFPDIRGLAGFLSVTGKNAGLLSAGIDATTAAFVGGQSHLKAFAEQSKSVGVQWDKMKAGLAVLAIEVGEKLIPALNTALQWVQANWPQISAIVAAGTSAIQAAIGATAAWIRANWGTISTVFATTWAGIVAAWPTVQAVFTALVTAGQAVVGWVRANWPQISKTVTDVAQSIQTVIQTTVAVVTALWNRFGSAILAVTRAAWESIKGQVQGALNVIRGIVNIIGGLMSGDWSRVWQGIKQVFSGALQAMVALLRGMVTILGTIAKALGAAVLDGIRAGLSALAGVVSSAFGRLWAYLSSAAGQALGKAKAIGKGIVDGIVAGLASLAGAVKGALDVLWGIISGVAASAYGAATAIGSGIVGGIVAGLGSLVGAVAGAIAGGVQSAIAGAKGALGIGSPSKVTFVEIGIPLAQGLIAGFTQYLLANGTKKLVDAAKKATNIVGALLPAINAAGQVIGSAQAMAIARGFVAGQQTPAQQIKAALTTAVAEAHAKARAEHARQLQLTAVDAAVLVAAKTIGMTAAREIAAGVKGYQPTLVEQYRATANAAVAAAKEATRTKAKEVADAFAQGITDARAKFVTAFSGLASAALGAFDAAVGAWKSPAEKLLAKMQLEDQINGLNKALTESQQGVTAAQDAYNKALAEGGIPAQELANKLAELAIAQQRLAQHEAAKTLNPAMIAADKLAIEKLKQQIADMQAGGAGNVQEAADAVIAAQERLGAAERAIIEFNLGQKAIKEREGHTKDMARRRLQFEDQLSALQRALAKHPEEHAKIQAKINALLDSYVPGYKQSGFDIGAAIARGIRDSIAEAVRAAREFAAAVAAALAGTPTAGPAPRSGGGKGRGSAHSAGMPRFVAPSAGRGGTTIILQANPQGTFVGDDKRKVANDLVDAMHGALLRKGSRNVALGLR